MKSALTAILTIAFVSSLVGAGTLAYFSDTETSSGNTFKAGTFDLEFGCCSLPLTYANKYPGYSKSTDQDIRNIGSEDGRFYITSGNFQEPLYPEIVEPSHSVEVSPEDFAKVLYVKVTADLVPDNDYTRETIIYDGSLFNLNTSSNMINIGAGKFIGLTFEVYLPANLDDPDTTEDEDDNRYQGDGVTADIIFYGEQTNLDI